MQIDPSDKAEYDSPAYDESYDPYEHCYKCPYFDCCEDGPLTEMECETLQTLRTNCAPTRPNLFGR